MPSYSNDNISSKKTLFAFAIGIVLLILIADQVLKVWIKTHMYIGEEVRVFGDWFIIHFTENNGMAFGLELGSDYGKMALSLFRILAVIGIGYYLYKVISKGTIKSLVVSLSMVMAGAIGNIIDSAFYGMIFSESYHSIATLFPESGGYSSFLHGKVVDMLYFPVIDTDWPKWVPYFGGEHLIFFRPVFNIADSSITIGMAMLILFHRKFFKEAKKVSEIDPSSLETL